MPNTLYFGDNLDILREHIADDSVDLIYLDPPFNSKRDYSLLFKTPKGHASEAQITAFEDSWHWGEQAEHEYAEILQQPNTDAAEMIQSLRRFLHENDMLAYLVMMCNRLLELHRVLKPTGSLYLHCDPTASHYLKLVADAIFEPQNFQSEIIWKRYGAHNDSKGYGAVHDTILFYGKGRPAIFNKQFQQYDEEYVAERFRFSDPDGRRWSEQNLASPNPRPNLTYAFTASNGITYQPPPNGWKCTRERMEQLDREGRLHFPNRPDGRLRLKNYLDELPGVPVQDVWTDISLIGGTSPERLGYQTQKPLALLERIVNASSNPNDVVLDPFCGCGTTVHAAQKLGRQWIGIDITPLAITLIEKRLKAAFPGAQFEVEGIPKDLDGAQNLALRDKYHFQWWACALVGAQPYQGKKKGADSGIDGLIYFQDDKGAAKKIVVSVKGGESVGVSQIRDLAHVVEREQAAIGLFVTLTPPTRPMKVEAVSAGHYHSAHFGDFDKIQILTIDGLLNGTEYPQYPNRLSGNLGFKKARVEEEHGQQGELL
ncbi:MAG: restriction endonuclease [Chloroflexi bacterium]|nr:restriction endonuclease [Chloroflexota bacterium]